MIWIKGYEFPEKQEIIYTEPSIEEDYEMSLIRQYGCKFVRKRELENRIEYEVYGDPSELLIQLSELTDKKIVIMELKTDEIVKEIWSTK